MKKLLGYVLSLILLTTSVSAGPSSAAVGTSAKKACGTMYFCYANTISSIYYPEFKTEIWYSTKDRDYFYVFQGVNQATKFHWFNLKHKFYGTHNMPSGGTYIGYYTSLEDAKMAANLDLQKKIKQEKIIAEEKRKKEEEERKRVAKKEREQKEANKPKIKMSSEIDSSLITIGSGSGFYINNKGYALTNNHVVDICKQSVAVVDGKETLFRVISTDKINDVAVLKTDYKSKNYIKINEDGAKLGENVIAVGYPLAGRLSDSVKITRGIVSSLSGLDNNIGQIQIDAALQPGNSGGPVLNENGELVGIASAGLNKLLMAKEAKYIPENVNFAVASPIVVNILKSKKVKYATPSMFSGSFSNTELAELGDNSTIQLFCRNTRTAYNRLKSSNKYSTVLLDLD